MTWSASGIFYESDYNKYRSLLNVRRVDSAVSEPELIAVMMNPGGSYPLEGDSKLGKEVAASPDRTQQQIMKVCDACGITSFRVINLSDLREPVSDKFIDFLAEPGTIGGRHSIFHPTRKGELDSIWLDGVPVIYGWGVNSSLQPLARRALATLNVSAPLGWKKGTSDWEYYHPLPKTFDRQRTWVDIVTAQLNAIR